MQGLPAGQQIASPIPGKLKNCSTWAEYEMPNQSVTAALCHGGRFDGKFFPPCPVRGECKGATINRTRGGDHVQLPVLNPTNVGLRPIVSQQAISSGSFRPMSFGQSTLPAMSSPQGSRPVVPQQRQFETSFPQPIIPPADYPSAMRTPYASATTIHGGGTSPTFLPVEGENVFERLGKNMIQGALAACGWHIFDYARAVDIFR